MAQFSYPAIKYTGSLTCKRGTKYFGNAFTLGNLMQMKTKGVKVSISSMDAFDVSFNDYGYVDTTATYTFSKDCILAFGDVVEVT